MSSAEGDISASFKQNMTTRLKIRVKDFSAPPVCPLTLLQLGLVTLQLLALGIPVSKLVANKAPALC